MDTKRDSKSRTTSFLGLQKEKRTPSRSSAQKAQFAAVQAKRNGKESTPKCGKENIPVPPESPKVSKRKYDQTLVQVEKFKKGFRNTKKKNIPYIFYF